MSFCIDINEVNIDKTGKGFAVLDISACLHDGKGTPLTSDFLKLSVNDKIMSVVLSTDNNGYLKEKIELDDLKEGQGIRLQLIDIKNNILSSVQKIIEKDDNYITVDLLREILKESPDPIFLVRADEENKGQFYYVNNAACELLGVSKEKDLLGLTFYDIEDLREDEVDGKFCWNSCFSDVVKSGDPFILETRLIRQDSFGNETVPVELNVKYKKGCGQSFIIISARSIIERKKLEWMLSVSNIINETSELLLSKEYSFEDTMHIIMNKAMNLTDSKYGYISLSKDELIGDYRTKNIDSSLLKSNEKQVFIKNSDECPDFSDIHMIDSAWPQKPICLNDMKGFFGENLPKTLSSAKSLFHTHIKDLDGEIIGKLVLIDSKNGYTFNKDIKTIVLLLGLYSLYIKRYQLLEKVKELNKHLEERVSEELKKRIQQEALVLKNAKLAVLGGMISAIAHQWRQPLNSLGLYIQELEEAYKYGELDEAYIKDAVEKCMMIINFMAKTVDNFRNFYKTDKEKQKFSLINSINETISMLCKGLEENKVSLIINGKIIDYKENCCYTFFENDLDVIGFKNSFMQVIMNLINNAKDAILSSRGKDILLPNKGSIYLDFKKEDENIILIVKDNAGGIKNIEGNLLEEDIGEIFNPDYSTKGEEGTGIGLSLSKEIIEDKFGGKMFVENFTHEDGLIGAKFTMIFPVNEEQMN